MTITNDNRLVDGNHALFSFPDRAEAETALKVIRHYGFDNSCYVGRPGPSFRYMLRGTSAPQGSMPGEDCLRFNPALLRIVEEPSGYLMTDGSSRMMTFPNRGEADQTLAIIKKYGFTYHCFVGRPDPSIIYMRK